MATNDIDPIATTALHPRGILAQFHQVGILSHGDIHMAIRLAEMTHETNHDVILAVALLFRSLRQGSTCLDFHMIISDYDDTLTWPPIQSWIQVIKNSILVKKHLLYWDYPRLYLQKNWDEEQQICTTITDLKHSFSPLPLIAEHIINDLFTDKENSPQRQAGRIALTHPIIILTGGPGTGKTTTVIKLLTLLMIQAHHAGRPEPKIGLAAPTGRAAARISEVIADELDKIPQQYRQYIHGLQGLQARTLHRLLHIHKQSLQAGFHRGNSLPYDIVVVDETSMVSANMMAMLFDALPHHAHLILVGDADQLASVDAGTIMADLVDGLSSENASPVVHLKKVYRYNRTIGALAQAIRANDPDKFLSILCSGDPAVRWTSTLTAVNYDELLHSLVDQAKNIHDAAAQNDHHEALRLINEHRFLCAHRNETYGVHYWNKLIASQVIQHYGYFSSQWYVGRPILITQNDYRLGVMNGDIGITLVKNGRMSTLVQTATQDKEFLTHQLIHTSTLYATTIHKAQGSEFDNVTIMLPHKQSRLLTRELLYTAITRAKQHIHLIASPEVLISTIARRAQRASGLTTQLHKRSDR